MDGAAHGGPDVGQRILDRVEAVEEHTKLTSLAPLRLTVRNGHPEYPAGTAKVAPGRSQHAEHLVIELGDLPEVDDEQRRFANEGRNGLIEALCGAKSDERPVQVEDPRGTELALADVHGRTAPPDLRDRTNPRNVSEAPIEQPGTER